jgi:hypothetical protein
MRHAHEHACRGPNPHEEVAVPLLLSVVNYNAVLELGKAYVCWSPSPACGRFQHQWNFCLIVPTQKDIDALTVGHERG